ncbi:MAG: cupin fold metalloprotein, WbuC family [Methylococcaceae bacterium]|nr:cupin fold metalloprotein, WbuC family [Desulfuromonas sp.]NJD07239.1 cupin fold metalloprotein, WbuC family [Methylococcaceae bacterium]
MTELKTISHTQLAKLSQSARQLPRRRKNLNLHPVLEDPIQRLFNALEPGTYARPHWHARPDGWELMLAAAGAFDILIFDESGRLTDRIELASTYGNLLVEIPPYTWHSLVARQPQTVMFEVKPGPYQALDDKDFAVWAAPEGSLAAVDFLAWMETARPGDRVPSP